MDLNSIFTKDTFHTLKISLFVRKHNHMRRIKPSTLRRIPRIEDIPILEFLHEGPVRSSAEVSRIIEYNGSYDTLVQATDNSLFDTLVLAAGRIDNVFACIEQMNPDGTFFLQGHWRRGIYGSICRQAPS